MLAKTAQRQSSSIISNKSTAHFLDGPLLKRRKTKAADSRYAKASRGRTKKDKDLEDSNTSSNERLKALLNAKTRDSLSARVETAIEYCTLEE
ncbi:hypothetical protein HBI66_010650 [Parastagonospora nodorum]|nr:hypothetical protein HBI66_010650 [Parastagonospora nodorum]